VILKFLTFADEARMVVKLSCTLDIDNAFLASLLAGDALHLLNSLTQKHSTNLNKKLKHRAN